YETVEVPDIPLATAPRVPFTVVRSPPRPSRDRAPAPPRARSPRKRAPSSVVPGGLLVTTILGGTFAAVVAWRSSPDHPDSRAPSGELSAAAPTGTPDVPEQPMSLVPRTRTAPPSSTEWDAAPRLRLAPVGCYRKVVREWLKLNCSDRAKPNAISGI